MQWLRHDLDAAADQRILVLLSRHGAEGYGAYWLAIETLVKNDGYIQQDMAVEIFSAVWKLPPERTQALLKTLLDTGLLVETENGLTSRRLLQEIAMSKELVEKRREAGRKGGTAKARQRYGKIEEEADSTIQASAKQVLSKCQASAKQNCSKSKQSLSKAQAKSSTVQYSTVQDSIDTRTTSTTLVPLAEAPTHETCGKPVDKPVENSPKRNGYPEDFLEFWTAYPKRAGNNPKKPAFKRWQAATKRASPETIIAGARRYAEYLEATGKIGTEYVQQAQTWLNQDGWENEYEAPAAPSDKMSASQRQLQEEGAAIIDCLGREMRWNE